jgi:hypothetical protein
MSLMLVLRVSDGTKLAAVDCLLTRSGSAIFRFSVQLSWETLISHVAYENPYISLKRCPKCERFRRPTAIISPA